MKNGVDRRSFLRAAALAGAFNSVARPQGKVVRESGSRVRIGLNAYSFDKPLKSGALTLEDVVHYCAQHGLDAIDATGYYFTGYPQVPADQAIYALKRTALLNGVSISGSGVRNDFTNPGLASRQRDVQMVKDWVEVASKLGAPVLRVFTGPKIPDGHSFDEVFEWMVPHFQECAAYGKRHGVVIGLQNHNDFLKTADQTIRLVNAVRSDWFGVILDVGSLRQGDPYEEIDKLAPYAVSWQLKELVGFGGEEVPTDLHKIRVIVEKTGYRGFLPIETLGAGDPKLKVAAFLELVRREFV